MTDEQRQQLLDALLTHFVPDGFQSLLEQACDEAIARYQQSLAPHGKANRFQRDAAELPPSYPPALLVSENTPPSEPLARTATLPARDVSSDRLTSTPTHDSSGGASSAHGRASEPPTAPGADTRIAARDQAQPHAPLSVAIPTNPLLRHLDTPTAPHSMNGRKITDEILRRSVKTVRPTI